MGILDRFKGGTATVTAAAQSADIVPGGALDLSYEIGGELDYKCRAVSAGLTCIGTFITPERGRDANGHPIERDVRHEVKLHDEQQDLPLASDPGSRSSSCPRMLLLVLRMRSLGRLGCRSIGGMGSLRSIASRSPFAGQIAQPT
jgi:hypothetical protein